MAYFEMSVLEIISHIVFSLQSWKPQTKTHPLEKHYNLTWQHGCAHAYQRWCAAGSVNLRRPGICMETLSQQVFEQVGLVQNISLSILLVYIYYKI